MQSAAQIDPSLASVVVDWAAEATKAQDQPMQRWWDGLSRVEQGAVLTPFVFLVGWLAFRASSESWHEAAWDVVRALVVGWAVGLMVRWYQGKSTERGDQ